VQKIIEMKREEKRLKMRRVMRSTRCELEREALVTKLRELFEEFQEFMQA
jgi:hypothetical protein